MSNMNTMKRRKTSLWALALLLAVLMISGSGCAGLFSRPAGNGGPSQSNGVSAEEITVKFFKDFNNRDFANAATNMSVGFMGMLDTESKTTAYSELLNMRPELEKTTVSYLTEQTKNAQQLPDLEVEVLNDYTLKADGACYVFVNLKSGGVVKESYQAGLIRESTSAGDWKIMHISQIDTEKLKQATKEERQTTFENFQQELESYKNSTSQEIDAPVQ